MWTLFLLLLPSICRCAPPFSQELKNCDDLGPRVSELSLNSALSTFLCYTEEEIGAMEEVDKKRKLAQKIAPFIRNEHMEELLKVPSDSLVKIVNDVMNNRNAETDHKTIEEYGAVFDEHLLETNVDKLSFNPHLNANLENVERNGRDAFLSKLESWFNFGGPEVSSRTATPQIMTPSQTFRVSLGNSVVLPCSVHSLGSLLPLWKHKEHVLSSGKQMVNPDVSKYQLVNGYNLQIRNIRDSDAGNYTCYITTLGQPVTLNHTIEIIGLGCPWDKTITTECMCGSNRCGKGSVCASGSKCITDCKYRYREVESDCFCTHFLNPAKGGSVCRTKQVCTYTHGCYRVCKPGKVDDQYCYCQDRETTGTLSPIGCEHGDICVTDGHCHYDYKVSGVSTNPVTAKMENTLWTNKPYRIDKMPEQLINSILFQPTDSVGKKTIQLTSPHDSTVFLALDEYQHGGLMEFLPQHDWNLKDNDNWVVEYKDYLNPNQNYLLKIWYKEIKENEPLTFTTNEDGAKFVIIFSTDCDPSLWKYGPPPRVIANCLCKSANDDKGARHCITGQGCKHGSCHDLPIKGGGRK